MGAIREQKLLGSLLSENALQGLRKPSRYHYPDLLLFVGVFFFWEQEVAKKGRLPVVNFAAGGIATPADAALMMQLGVDGEGENRHPIALPSMRPLHQIDTSLHTPWIALFLPEVIVNASPYEYSRCALLPVCYFG